jgi:DNA polymerase-3 subunit delta
MEHLNLIRDIKKGNTAPVYFLMGEEAYFIDEVLNAIENDVLSENERIFGLNVLYGRDVTIKDVIHMARSFPMSGEKQVVVVREAQDLREWKKTDDMAVFESYLKNPLTTTVLALAFKDKVLDKRLKISKAILKYARVFQSDRVKEDRIPAWIQGYMASKGASIDHAASNLLAEYLGNDLGKVVNELGKLIIIVPAGTTITAKHIEENIGISKDFNVWELQKALAVKDIQKSNRIINYFEANPKASPVQLVIPSLYSFFARVAVFVTFPDHNTAQKAMSINSYAYSDCRAASNNYSKQKIELIIGHLREADRRSKGIDNESIENGMMMKELVFKILH